MTDKPSYLMAFLCLIVLLVFGAAGIIAAFHMIDFLRSLLP